MRSRGIRGVAITAVQPGSRAARAGLASNEVLLGVGDVRITGLRMLRGLAGARPRQLVLVVADDQGSRYVVVN